MIIFACILVHINAIKVDSLLRNRQFRTVHCTCYICASSRYKFWAYLLTSTQRKKSALLRSAYSICDWNTWPIFTKFCMKCVPLENTKGRTFLFLKISNKNMGRCKYMFQKWQKSNWLYAMKWCVVNDPVTNMQLLLNVKEKDKNARKLSLAFGLMASTNESLELRLWNLVWRWIKHITTILYAKYFL